MTLSSNSSDSGFEVHEVIFAESLGVNLQEEFALELLEVASKALYVLPDGWEVGLAESELGTIPFFYDTNTDQSHWVHPYAQDLKMLIEEKRLELLRGEDVFNEEDDIDDDEEFFVDSEDISNARVNPDISEIDALAPRTKPAIDELSVISEENKDTDSSKQNDTNADEAGTTTTIEATTETKESISSSQKNIRTASFNALETQETKEEESKEELEISIHTEDVLQQSVMNPDVESPTAEDASETNLESTDRDISNVEESKFSEGECDMQINQEGSIGKEEVVEIIDSSDAIVVSESPEKSITLPQETVIPPESISQESTSNKLEVLEQAMTDEKVETVQSTIDSDGIVESQTAVEPKAEIITSEEEQLPASTNEKDTVVPETEDKISNVGDVNNEGQSPVDDISVDKEITESASLVADTPLNSLEGGISLADIEDDAFSLASNSSSALAIVATEQIAPMTATPEKENRSSPIQLENKDMTPPKGIPLPTDPFADFFAIDPSFHQFIDDLEKKQKQKKKKLLTKAGRSPTKASISASVDEENIESLDLDEIIRRRRQAERAEELEKARIQKEKEAKEEDIRRKQQQAIEEEKAKQLLLQQEKEAAEKAAKEAQEKAEQARKAAEEAEEVRKKQESEAIIAIPTVAAPSPPFAKTTRTIDLSDTTKSLFDDLVAQESVPDNDDNEDANPRSVHFQSTLSFTQKLEAAQTPATPLDKSIDVMDHFRNIYSAPSTADPEQQQRPRGTQHQSHVTTDLHTPDVSPAKSGRFLDTTKLVPKSSSKRSKKKSQHQHTLHDPASATSPTTSPPNNNNTNNNFLTSTSAPKLKPHATSVDGWVILAAYTNYKEAERAVALFEALAPTKSIAGQSFPSHSKFLPPVKGKNNTNNNNALVMEDSTSSSPLKKKSLLLSNAPITKESILLSTQQELPQVRIARDLGRMQWIVECNDVQMKKVFERRIARRLHQGQGAEKLLAHLSPAKQQALGLNDDNDDGQDTTHRGTKKTQRKVSPLKHIGEKFTAPFVPQALISSKNTKHVSGQMHVQYALPRVSYDEQQKTKSFRNSSSYNNNNNNSTAQSGHDGATTHRGPLTFRAVSTMIASSSPSKPRPSSTHLF